MDKGSSQSFHLKEKFPNFCVQVLSKNFIPSSRASEQFIFWSSVNPVEINIISLTTENGYTY